MRPSSERSHRRITQTQTIGKIHKNTSHCGNTINKGLIYMLPKTPAKGMRDFLPKDFKFRQQVLSIIQSTYERYGFARIETPSVENIALLTSKQGGDNEKLIFKILKRGEKLENADETSLCDLGLRYDLTVPLSRFYANNSGQLPQVFKAIQMDNV